jgi:hypothetical protein
MGVRVITRDVEGFVLAATCTIVPFSIDPIAAEAVAAWKAVKFCRYIGLQQVFIERDTLKIVHTLRQEGTCWSQYGKLIKDIRAMLNGLQLYFVGYIFRETN